MPRTEALDGLDGTGGTAGHKVVVVASEGLGLLELGIALEVFALPRPELTAAGWYETEVCSADGSELSTLAGVTVGVRNGLPQLASADTVLVPAWDVAREPPAGLVDALLAARERGARLVSICSGAFLLAAAGFLDGRDAATHWRYAQLLARRHPRVRVKPDVLWVGDGSVFTSAGSAAGIDLCLHLVRLDNGAAVANNVARRLVAPPHREGGHAQLVDQPVAAQEGDPLAGLLDWLRRNPDERVSLADMAARCHMSKRTFLRRFQAATGTTPYRWLTRQRVMLSLPLLEDGSTSVEAVARTVGFAHAVTYREHFRNVMGTTPTAYRRTFSGRARHGTSG